MVGLNRGVGMDAAQCDHVLGVIAAFLAHLAPRGGEWARVFRIHHSARYFQGKVADPVTELAHHHDFVGRGYRDDVYPGWRLDDEEVVLAAARMRALVKMQV